MGYLYRHSGDWHSRCTGVERVNPKLIAIFVVVSLSINSDGKKEI